MLRMYWSISRTIKILSKLSTQQNILVAVVYKWMSYGSCHNVFITFINNTTFVSLFAKRLRRQRMLDSNYLNVTEVVKCKIKAIF